MQHLLNYKALNRELLEPHLQEMRRDSTQTKNSRKKKKGSCIHNAGKDNAVKGKGNTGVT